MKAYLGRMVDSIGAQISRRRQSDQPDTQEHELRAVSPSQLSDSASAYRQVSHSPSPPPERICTPEADEVLYRKNNVMLKYPIARGKHNSRTKENGTPSPTSSFTGYTSSSSVLDNQVLVPGFLFITTRGSKYGSTLILNWAPNSSMRVPDIHVPPPQRSPTSNSINNDYVTDGDSDDSLVRAGTANPSQSSGEKYTGAGEATKVDLEQPSCSSVSIDLGMMEKIRIFYNTDDQGFITSGEMVIRGKDQDFKVRSDTCKALSFRCFRDWFITVCCFQWWCFVVRRSP